MLEKIKMLVQSSKPVQFGLVLLSGIAIGAIFYPSKHIEEKLTQKHQEEITQLKEEHAKELKQEEVKLQTQSEQFKSYKVSTESKISKLTTQVTELKSKKTADYYKIVHPDGTVEIRKHSESETEESQKIITQVQQEFKQKIDEVEKRWEKAYKDRLTVVQSTFDAKEQDYKKQIDELTKSKVVDINKKSFGVAAGVLGGNFGSTLGLSYYGNISYDVFGPFFLDFQGQFGASQAGGLGVGLRF